MDNQLQRRTFLRGAFIASVTLVGASCVNAGAANVSAGAAEHEIDIQNFAFNPAVLNARVGDTIRWTNNDSASHTASAVDGSWSSGTLNNGNSYSMTLQTLGQYEYFCKFHPRMKATIIVS